MAEESTTGSPLESPSDSEGPGNAAWPADDHPQESRDALGRLQDQGGSLLLCLIERIDQFATALPHREPRDGIPAAFQGQDFPTHECVADGRVLIDKIRKSLHDGVHWAIGVGRKREGPSWGGRKRLRFGIAPCLCCPAPD